MNLIKNQMFVRTLRLIIGLILVFISQYLFSMAHSIWEPLTLIICLVLWREKNLQQAILFFAVLVTTLVISKLLTLLIPISWLIGFGILASIIAWFFYLNSYPNDIKQMTAFVAVINSLYLVNLANQASYFGIIHDISMGFIASLFVTFCVLPQRPDQLFRERMIVLLTAYSCYLKTIVAHLLKIVQPDANIHDLRSQLNNLLYKPNNFFPEWVYQPGFVPLLQQGHRHFLVKMEQLGDVLVAMDFYTQQMMNNDLLEALTTPINQCAQRADETFKRMILLMNFQPSDNTLVCFNNDVLNLENEFWQLASLPLELIDMSEQSLAMLTFIYTMKDLYVTLASVNLSLRP
jgi:hypothetical protein